MAKVLQNTKRTRWWQAALLLIAGFLVIVSCSITIDSIDQADSVNGGDTLSSTLHVTINTNDTRNNTKFMVALLVPKSWNSAAHSKITFTSSITTGTQTMSPVAPGVAAPQGGGKDWPTVIAEKVGNGGNLLPGWEWVAFYSDNAYSVVANLAITVTISIKVKVGVENLSFKLGYVVANSSDGLSGTDYYASAFPGCFRVFGQGDLLDYCNPQLSTVDPLKSLENDIVTLNFDGGIIDTELKDADEVYLCMKGVTTNGDTLNACAQDDRTKLTSYALKKWRIDLWPRQFFKLGQDQHLSGLVYYFTDKTGQKLVGKDGTGATPFTYTFSCE
ncbi:DUF4961 domain-containing protein [Arachidicoccus terrestris]|uniref:DUF4961 domain-containing protein n=1 Tax=Arachidicoccus terrestris TaxID=2875539 RepID=UPI001CC57947|nr:DUF4961 domain-containing protein [Arachidicoccus terrestris]UAY55281.1 DUF4961 domain-containing protein [Arachidicoccus terrestris]